MTTENGPSDQLSETKWEERRAFLFLAVLLAPILSIAIVGGLGFLIWMAQIIGGPPTG